jgi:putative colanic acid biosynthesis glycosyltransferase WcaI
VQPGFGLKGASNLRFLIVTQYFAPEIGATQVRLCSLCRELVRVGHEVEVVTAMPHHPGGRIFPEYRGRSYLCEEIDGFLVHRVWLWTAAGSGLCRLLSYLSFMFTCLIGLAKAQKPDFVYVDSPPLFLGLPGWLAARHWRRPFIFNVADLWPDSVLDLGIMHQGMLLKVALRLEAWIYRRADFVTAVTKGIADTLTNRKRVRPEKLLFLPNGVDTDLIRPIPPDAELERRLNLQGKRIAVYAGNHGYAAGAEQILRAAELLKDRDSLHFLFIGDGPDKSRLRVLAQVLQLSNATFLDSVPLDDLPGLLSLAEIAVITLRRAGVTRGARPAKTFVMMAAAKPIVLAAEGESEDLILKSGAGLAVAPDDPQAFATAIEWMMDHPEAARQMGQQGRQFVQQHFQWSALVDAWLSQLKNGAGTARRAGTFGEASPMSAPSQAKEVANPPC